MGIELTCEYNAIHRILLARISGELDCPAIQEAMVEIVSAVRSSSARGVILDLTDAVMTLQEEDYRELQGFFLKLYGGDPIPIGLVSREHFPKVVKYARRAQEAGRPVQACLTYCEGLAWIDYNTVGYVPSGRQGTLRRVHDALTLLSDSELEAILAAIEARAGLRSHSR